MIPLLFLLTFPLAAQVRIWSSFGIGGGVVVEAQFFVDVGQASTMNRMKCTPTEHPGFVRRTVCDDSGRPVLGYELAVKSNNAPEPRYRLTVRPIDGLPLAYFAKSPSPVDVSESDLVEFVIMENRLTSARMVDRYRVGRVGRQSTAAFPDSPEGLPALPASTTLRIDRPHIFREGQEVAEFGDGSVSGTGGELWLYRKGFGRVRFSAKELGQWRASGWVEGSKLGWIWNKVKYEARCKSPVVEYPGRWPLWVLYDPTYAEPSNDVSLGAASVH